MPTDTLARELYGSHVNASGRIFAGAFRASPKNNFGLSVNRWCKAPAKLFNALGLEAAKRRSGSFKGFALFHVSDLEKAKLENIKLIAMGKPTWHNPFHADIPVPPDREDDFYLLVQSEFIEHVKPKFVKALP